MHKKGIFGLEEVVSIFSLVLLSVIFIFIFGGCSLLGGVEEEIESLDVLSEKDSFYAFLDSEVVVNKMEMTFGDLIVKSVEMGDFSDLENEMNKAFDAIDVCWYLRVYDFEDNKKLGEIFRKNCIAEGHNAVFQRVLIPRYDNSEVLKVELKLPRRAP